MTAASRESLRPEDPAAGQATDPFGNRSAQVVEVGPMPTRDVLKRKLRRPAGRPSGFDALLGSPFLRRPRRRPGDPDEGGVPVEPDRPGTLSGGAAAAMDFEGG